MDEQQKIELLQKLIIDNDDLEDLESRISEFNIFEAMGAVRQELRHSDFLAFLLNPSEKHGLDDKFLKRFFIKVLSSVENTGNIKVSPIDIKLTDFSKAIVERETQNIDILISDDESGIVCLIENKIFSSEHSGQLARYLKIVKQRFPKAKTIIPVFLTPDGISPEDKNSPYILFNYEEISEIIEQIRQTQESMIGVAVNTMMRHYITMLRRHVVSNSDIAELCRKIYREHKHAFDLIVEHMPDIREEIFDYLVEIVNNRDDFLEVNYSKKWITFVKNKWQNFPTLKKEAKSGVSSPTIFIQFRNGEDLSLDLYIKMDTQVHQPVREAISKKARANPDVFRGYHGKTVLYKMSILQNSDYQEGKLSKMIDKIDVKWQQFIEKDFPAIHAHLMEIPFDNLME